MSKSVYKSLNLGDHVGDDIDLVGQNRRLVAGAAGFAESGIVISRQVHAKAVQVVTKAGWTD